MAIVETASLTRRFGPITAVDRLTLAVEAGEVFGLLGPNGAGKTTAIKMLITLLPPSAGSARVAGFDVVRQAGQVRRLIGYVPQLLSADGTLTGYENLWGFAHLYDLPRAEREGRIREALALMDLADAADRLVRDYSGGMIRRLEVAQAILHRPPVLFLDEPTLGLDPLAREVVWDHVRALRAAYGTTVFLTTHYLEEADALCGRVAILHHGAVAALGAPAELLTRAVQPALWLLVFGQALAAARAIPTGEVPYLDFLAPGILAQSVLFIAIFYGISAIWERDLGIVHKFLVSPTPRAALVLGKALSAGVRALAQAAIVYLLAALLGVDLDPRPLALLGVAGVVALGAALFSTFSLVVACLVKTRERFMGIGQVLTMPLFFASNAIYPIGLMPGWLQGISHANPLTYEVDALRALMLADAPSGYGVGVDLVVLLLVTVLLVALAGRLYPTLGT